MYNNRFTETKVNNQNKVHFSGLLVVVVSVAVHSVRKFSFVKNNVKRKAHVKK